MNLDRDEVNDLLGTTGENNANFKKVQYQLDTIQEEQKIMSWSYIWDMKDGGVNPIGYTTNLNEVYEAGELFADLAPEHVEAAKLAIENNQTKVSDVFEDPFGAWRTVFSPIKDGNGEIIALLGIDYSADYINTIIRDSVIKQIAITASGLYCY